MQQWDFWHNDEGSKHRGLRRSELREMEQLDPRVQRLINQPAEVHASMLLVVGLCEYVVLYGAIISSVTSK